MKPELTNLMSLDIGFRDMNEEGLRQLTGLS
jgi:hypothetical protein